jgi:hypothetical protein
MEEKILRHLIIKTVRENTQLTELVSARGGSAADDALIDEVVKSEGEEANDAITDVGDIKPSEEVAKEETK